MKLYKTREKILGPLGNDRYETLYEKGEIVMVVNDTGPFVQVRRVNTNEKPRMVSQTKLEEYKAK
jgi:hypothetical protein